MASSAASQEYYSVGQVLTLDIVATRESSHPVTTVQVRIRKLIQPRTLSCCMLVDTLNDKLSNEPLLLKLYDRRFSDQLRSDKDVEPWIREDEEALIEAVQTGAAQELVDNLANIPNFQRDTEDDWDDGQIETFMAEKARKFFAAETEVYDRLVNLQGDMIPTLFARVRLPLAPACQGLDADMASRFLDVNGILLQYIDGFHLSVAQERIPQRQWQGIVDQALDIVRVIGDHEVLNQDVRSDSFIIRNVSGWYQVTMIDFGLARLRAQDESDRDWACAKLRKGEERAVWFVMKRHLKHEGFEVQFEESDRYSWVVGGDEEP